MGKIRPTYFTHPRLRMPLDACVYDYGDPNEAGVLEQWIFDETSGDIVGRTNSTTLSADGTPDYEQTATGDFECLSPGIHYGNEEFHNKDGADSNLDIGTGAFTFEMWGSVDAAPPNRDGTVFACYDAAITQGYLFFCDIDNSGLLMGNPITGSIITTFANYSALTPGEVHKWRTTDTGARNSGGSLSIILDGVNYGTGNMTPINGDNIIANNVRVGARNDVINGVPSVRDFLGTCFEIRMSAAEVNSGGPGGG